MESKYTFWFGTFIMVMFSSAVVAFIAFYKSRLAWMKRQETEHLLRATMELEIKERRRIAADLHDSICGDLGAIRNYLAILEQGDFDAAGKEILHEIKESVTTVLQNTKKISYNMMPPLIETGGLAAAVEEYVHRIKKMHSVDIWVQCNTQQDIGLNTVVSYELYRIIQELLTNTLKYGNVSWIAIKIYDSEDSVSINIADDGNTFFIKEQLRISEGIGVKNIFSRINYIGAELIQLPKPEGNEIQVVISKQN